MPIAAHVLSVGAKIPGVSMNVHAVLRDIPTVGLNVGLVAGDIAAVRIEDDARIMLLGAQRSAT